jgi:pimeloyl-ACP methyl ester carboxylesterase
MKLIVAVLPLLLLTGLLLFLLQGRLVYFPQPIPEAVRRRWADHEITLTRDGLLLQAWYVGGPVSTERPLVVYFGGNAEEVSPNLDDLPLTGAGAMLTFNYPGFGASEGRPSERRILGDALFVFDEVTRRNGIGPGDVVLLGRSLGSGVAVHLASQRPVRGVILVTPFDSLVGVARLHYPFLPVRLLLRHRFDSLSLAPSISVPALFLVSGKDGLIPPELSHRLAEAWGGPVRMVIIERTAHNDIQVDDRYWQAINAFVQRL